MTTQNNDAGCVREASPIENLNDRLFSNNSELDSLLNRLNNLGSRISANLPMPETELANKQNTPNVPFNEGILMMYFNGLNNQEMLITLIRNQVSKLESLL